MRRKSFGSQVRIATVVFAFFIGATLWNSTAEDAESSGIGNIFLSPEREAEMGISEFEKMKQSKTIVSSGSYHNMTQRVASRLVPLVNVPNAQWEFVVFKDDSPNAFALPGGKVGVHTGLFKVVDDETQLAAVLGHELAHVTEGHAGKRIKTAGIALGAATIGGLILQKKTGNEDIGKVAQAGATLGVLQFSRSQELEADHEGTILMARGGYDPREAITLWQQFAAYKAKNSKGAPPGFLSTHPVDSRRIDELEAMMPEALQYYRPAREAKAVGSTSSTSTQSNASPAAEQPSEEPPKAIRFLGNLFRAERPE